MYKLATFIRLVLHSHPSLKGTYKSSQFTRVTHKLWCAGIFYLCIDVCVSF